MLADRIKATITFVMSNYSLSVFILDLIVSRVAIVRSGPSVDRPLIVERLLAWYVFFSIGIDNFYNFVMHIFFGKMSASFIGWADSPCQLMSRKQSRSFCSALRFGVGVNEDSFDYYPLPFAAN